MLELFLTSQFKKDLKLVLKRGLKIDTLKLVVNKLLSEQILSNNYKDHYLKGNYLGYKECHIQPDWLLIFKISKTTKTLYLIRTGSRSDLFN